MTTSAGILCYKIENNEIKVLLSHPGGPLYAKKIDSIWSIQKGLFEGTESALETAKREFKEETGFDIVGEVKELGTVQQSKQKTVIAFALNMDVDVTKVISNTFEMEWPPKSGNLQTYPEMDRAEWFTIEEAKQKMLKGQLPLLEKLQNMLS